VLVIYLAPLPRGFLFGLGTLVRFRCRFRNLRFVHIDGVARQGSDIVILTKPRTLRLKANRFVRWRNRRDTKMKRLATICALMLAVTLPSASMAQQPATQKLAITQIESVKEPEHAVVQIVVVLENGSRMMLQMNVFTAQSLADQIAKLGI
jgi:hypothetical protein